MATRKTYWERIICAIRKGAKASAYDIKQIEIYYAVEPLDHAEQERR